MHVCYVKWINGTWECQLLLQEKELILTIRVFICIIAKRIKATGSRLTIATNKQKVRERRQTFVALSKPYNSRHQLQAIDRPTSFVRLSVTRLGHSHDSRDDRVCCRNMSKEKYLLIENCFWLPRFLLISSSLRHFKHCTGKFNIPMYLLICCDKHNKIY